MSVVPSRSTATGPPALNASFRIRSSSDAEERSCSPMTVTTSTPGAACSTRMPLVLTLSRLVDDCEGQHAGTPRSKVIRTCVPAPGGASISSESAMAAMTGRPTPSPGLSTRGAMPAP